MWYIARTLIFLFWYNPSHFQKTYLYYKYALILNSGSTMKKVIFLCVSTIALASVSSTVIAQDSDYHPVLTDNFTLTAGAFRSDNTLKIATSDPGRLPRFVDFDDTVGVDSSATIGNVELKWKFGSKRKWSIAGQYFSNNATGDAVLEEDVEWQDVVFNEGTFVDGGVKMEITRVFLGRSFVKNEQHDFGVGLGIHNLDLSAFIGGELIVNGESTGYKKVDAGGSQILPNVGAWYMFSPASRWLLHSRVDWISANVGNYDGTLWNINAGVNFQAWRHVGFGLSYQYFDLDAKVDSADLVGAAKMTYSGPVISVTTNW
jgi:hypothetical protein